MPINDSTRFHIGGRLKAGKGPLKAGFRVSDSYQVKGNVTRDVDGGAG